MDSIREFHLFAGIGGGIYGGKLLHHQCVGAVEIMPYARGVLAQRKKDGWMDKGMDIDSHTDITKLNGAELPVVDIITGGSPCQDLSVAGPRSGLSGSRSSLFMDAVRIAKEMRSARSSDDNLRHELRFWCWENVPGALSSRNGDDFRTVLEEVARIADPTANIPKPKKWGNSGVVDGDGWQIAWRIVDSQFFGVPQRRRRLFLICDLAGHSAGEILFERESMSWHYQEIAETWKDTSASLGERISRAGRIVMGDVRRAEEGMDSVDENINGYGETGFGYWQNGIQTSQKKI